MNDNEHNNNRNNNNNHANNNDNDNNDNIRGPRSTVRMVQLRTSTIIGYYRI